MTALPSGTVTFVFSEIEGRRGTAEALGERSPKDIDEPERVYELTIEDALRLRFPGQRPGDGSHQSSSTP